MTVNSTTPDFNESPLVQEMGRAARAAASVLAQASSTQKACAITGTASAVRAQAAAILAANAKDFDQAASAGLSNSLLDRLKLTTERVHALASSLEQVALLADPIGRVLAQWDRPNGLVIRRVCVPLGVIGIVYESRPNVTVDAGALCLLSGNAVILRGGSDALMTNRALYECLQEGLRQAGLPDSSVQLIPTTDRAMVGAMLAGFAGCIDVLVPRGGKSLVARVQEEARVPVIGHLEGNCHVYVDRDAEIAMARAVVLNSKMRRTGICGAAETLLLDRALGAEYAKHIIEALLDAGCEVRGDAQTQVLDVRVGIATEQDWATEYLAPIISVRYVDGIEGAIAHIKQYGSAHTESIVTANLATATRFLNEVDSAIVLHNASTQFADGGEFGMGAEIGISTSRFHARGPVGVEQLTSYKYQVLGAGQVRPG